MTTGSAPTAPLRTHPAPDGEKATEPGGPEPAPRRRRVPTGAVIGGAMLLAVLVAGLVCRYAFDPSRIDADAVLVAPSAAHPFGTDGSGRDVLLRTFAAAVADLPLALGGTLIAMVAGTVLGLLASTGGRAAEGIMRVVDGFQAFPLLLLILVIVQISGGGTAVLTGTIAILNIPRFIRLTRAEALQIRASRYVFFARVIGSPTRHLLRRHILPNVSGAICSQASIGAAIALSAIGAMSFLGLGIAPPTPSWGAMIQLGITGLTTGQWWPVAFPCLGLVYSIVAFNLLSDSLDTHFAREVR